MKTPLFILLSFLLGLGLGIFVIPKNSPIENTPTGAQVKQSAHKSPEMVSQETATLHPSSTDASKREKNESPPSLQEFALFPQVVKQATGRNVLPFKQNSETSQYVLDAVSKAIQQTCEELNASTSPVKGLRRINEASSYFEDGLQEKLDAQPDLKCAVPLNAQGKAQRTGYPDLHIHHLPSDSHFYLDPKLYEKTSENSSLRTFYYSPTSQSGKIHFDATHLLLGISHDGNDGNWHFNGWKITDLSLLSLKLKSEYNASNKQLYENNAVLHASPE